MPLFTLPTCCPLLAASAMNRHESLGLFLALGAMLGTARLLGEMLRRIRQPVVLGEILAGVVLGPTLLGRWHGDWHVFLFPEEGGTAPLLHGLTTVAIALYLFVAGMEVDLSKVWRQGRAALGVSVGGMAFPFVLGFAVALAVPGFMGLEPQGHPIAFALFLAIALSISALPVVAKTLMDLNLFRTDLGMTIVSAAVLNDLFGWILFAVVLGMVDVPAAQTALAHGAGAAATATAPIIEAVGSAPSGGPSGVASVIETLKGILSGGTSGGTSGGGGGAHPLLHTIVLTLGYTGLMLTLGRWLIHRVLPWFQAHLSWPGGVIGLVLTLALFGAAFTEWVGIHAIFGAFIVGVAVGDSSRLREQTRNTLHQFISFFFAPLFFASIGLHVDFVGQTDLPLVGVLLALSIGAKVVGCAWIGQKLGVDRREAWAQGFGLLSGGAMVIILGLIALQYHLITPTLYVALVIMAIVNSALTGPAMSRILRRPTPRRFTDYLSSKVFLPKLQATDRDGAIREMSHAVAAVTGRLYLTIDDAVRERERMMSTSLGHGLAIPHARLAGVSAPVVAVGLSKAGVDFNAADGEPVHVIFMIVTPLHDEGAQLEILADIARAVSDPSAAQRLMQAQGLTDFLAVLRSNLPATAEPSPV